MQVSENATNDLRLKFGRAPPFCPFFFSFVGISRLLQPPSATAKVTTLLLASGDARRGQNGRGCGEAGRHGLDLPAVSSGDGVAGLGLLRGGDGLLCDARVDGDGWQIGGRCDGGDVDCAHG